MSETEFLPKRPLNSQPELPDDPPPRYNDVVRPTGFSRVIQYFTIRNCILFIVILLMLTVVLCTINLRFIWSKKCNNLLNNITNQQHSHPTEQTVQFTYKKFTYTYLPSNLPIPIKPIKKPLQFSRRTLAQFRQFSRRMLDQFRQFGRRKLARIRNHKAKLYFDDSTDEILLSMYDDNTLRTLKLNVKSTNPTFDDEKQEIDDERDVDVDCTRFTSEILCCVAIPSSENFETTCLNYDSKDDTVHPSYAANYDFYRNWQSPGVSAVVLHNKDRRAVLDVTENKIYAINVNNTITSLDFYFPENNLDKLTELINEPPDRWTICEYERYLEEFDAKKCKELPFERKLQLPHAKLCVRPKYTAVLQFGHPFSTVQLIWQLYVKYNGLDVIYSAENKLSSVFNEIAMDCNDDDIDLYMLERVNSISYPQAIQFEIKLPDELSRRSHSAPSLT